MPLLATYIYIIIVPTCLQRHVYKTPPQSIARDHAMHTAENIFYIEFFDLESCNLISAATQDDADSALMAEVVASLSELEDFCRSSNH